jgi:hypothetical protein
MNFSDISSATTAGANVITAASGERSVISSSTRISRTESNPIRLVALFPLALFAAFVAACPARCSCSPGGAPAFGNVARSAAMTGLSPAVSLASRLAAAVSWTASPPGDSAT